LYLYLKTVKLTDKDNNHTYTITQNMYKTYKKIQKPADKV